MTAAVVLLLLLESAAAATSAEASKQPSKIDLKAVTRRIERAWGATRQRLGPEVAISFDLRLAPNHWLSALNEDGDFDCV